MMSDIVRTKSWIELNLRISPHPYERPEGLDIILNRMLMAVLNKQRLDLLLHSSIRDNIAMFLNHQRAMRTVVKKELLKSINTAIRPLSRAWVTIKYKQEKGGLLRLWDLLHPMCMVGSKNHQRYCKLWHPSHLTRSHVRGLDTPWPIRAAHCCRHDRKSQLQHPRL